MAWAACSPPESAQRQAQCRSLPPPRRTATLPQFLLKLRLPPQNMVIVLRESVRLIADVLQQLQPQVIASRWIGADRACMKISSSFLASEITIGGLIVMSLKTSMAAWSCPSPPSIRMMSG